MAAPSPRASPAPGAAVAAAAHPRLGSPWEVPAAGTAGHLDAAEPRPRVYGRLTSQQTFVSREACGHAGLRWAVPLFLPRMRRQNRNRQLDLSACGQAYDRARGQPLDNRLVAAVKRAGRAEPATQPQVGRASADAGFPRQPTRGMASAAKP